MTALSGTPGAGDLEHGGLAPAAAGGWHPAVEVEVPTARTAATAGHAAPAAFDASAYPPTTAAAPAADGALGAASTAADAFAVPTADALSASSSADDSSTASSADSSSAASVSGLSADGRVRRARGHVGLALEQPAWRAGPVWADTTTRPGWIRLRGRQGPESRWEQSLLARRITEHRAEAEVTVEARAPYLHPGRRAGPAVQRRRLSEPRPGLGRNPRVSAQRGQQWKVRAVPC